MEVAGLLVAFGPPGACLLSLWNRPQLQIVAVSSAFVFIVAQLVAAIAWIAIPPLYDIKPFHLVVRVAVLEAFRYLFFKLYRRVELEYSVRNTTVTIYPLQDISSSLVAGLSFGIMHSVMFYGMTLQRSLDRATLFSPSCPQMSVFTLFAWLALLFEALHAFLMPIAFDGYRRSSWIRVGMTVVFHLTAELLTLVVVRRHGCVALVPLEFGVVLASGVWLASIFKDKNYRSHQRGADAVQRLLHRRRASLVNVGSGSVR